MLVSVGGILVLKESIGASWVPHTLNRGNLKGRDDGGDRGAMLLKDEVTPFVEEVGGYHYHRRKIRQRDGHFTPSPYIYTYTPVSTMFVRLVGRLRLLVYECGASGFIKNPR